MSEIEVVFKDRHWREVLPGAGALARTAIQAVLRSEELSRRSLAVTVTLWNDAALQEMNLEWRGKDMPTNVLSFPLMSLKAKPLPGVPLQLGDIVLARQTLQREAKAEGKSLKAHYLHLVVHGMLHLLGHDHMTARQARAMERREVAVLKKLGVRNPYEAASTKA